VANSLLNNKLQQGFKKVLAPQKLSRLPDGRQGIKQNLIAS